MLYYSICTQDVGDCESDSVAVVGTSPRSLSGSVRILLGQSYNSYIYYRKCSPSLQPAGGLSLARPNETQPALTVARLIRTSRASGCPTGVPDPHWCLTAVAQLYHSCTMTGLMYSNSFVGLYLDCELTHRTSYEESLVTRFSDQQGLSSNLLGGLYCGLGVVVPGQELCLCDSNLYFTCRTRTRIVLTIGM
jgi:hypothetical protein